LTPDKGSPEYKDPIEDVSLIRTSDVQGTQTDGGDQLFDEPFAGALGAAVEQVGGG
jgi:hypothetical protein